MQMFYYRKADIWYIGFYANYDIKV